MPHTVLLTILLCIIADTTVQSAITAKTKALHNSPKNVSTSKSKFSLEFEAKFTKNPFLHFMKLTKPEHVRRSKRRSKRGIAKPKLKCKGLTSCWRRCTEKRQFHDVAKHRSQPACYCDPECGTVFSDCCADYEDTCKPSNKTKKVRPKGTNKRWKCFGVKDFPFGVWMIEKCKPGWKVDDVYQKCTNFSKEFLKASYVTPVFDKNRNTFRNRYCAQCNKVKKFTRWKSDIKCKLKVPKGYKEIDKVKHLDNYCDAASIKLKSETRGIRYCYDVQEKCQYRYNKKKCSKGIAGLVSLRTKSGYATYKNFDCLLCNQKKQKKSSSLSTYCGPLVTKLSFNDDRRIPFILKRSLVSSFGIAFNPKRGGSLPPVLPTLGTTSRCSSGYLYDGAAGYCRKPIARNEQSVDGFVKRYAIQALYELHGNFSRFGDDGAFALDADGSALSQIQQDFYGDFKKRLRFVLKEIGWQLSGFSVHVDNHHSPLVLFQVLGALVNKTNSTFPLERSKISKVSVLFRQQGEVVFCTYSLLEITTREMSCVDNSTYVINHDALSSAMNGTLFVNSTQENYKYGEYVLYKYQNETRIAVCKDYRPINCSYYLDVKNNSYWNVFSNGSVYTNVTASWYHYGEYSIINGTLWLCFADDLLFKLATDTNTSEGHYRLRSSTHDDILSYLTLVSLTISVVSLVVLLSVYSFFPSLRNLPGKNLMLFSATLAAGQLLWLLQREVYSWSSTACVAVSIALQYFFLSSFCCSSSIAFHSFVTFRALANGKLRRRSEGKAFVFFLVYGLGFPFVLVMTFWLLDFYEVVFIGYGRGQGHCWFGSQRGLYIAFLYPMFSLFLCNFTLLLATVRVIYKCTKASKKIAEKNGGLNRKHVGIYLRMCTMMGLTWLFGVFQLLFPNLLAFRYIFVVVNGLQGFYLAVAFLLTDNVRKIIFKKPAIERGYSTTMTSSTM